jgi:hypothetical protein
MVQDSRNNSDVLREICAGASVVMLVFLFGTRFASQQRSRGYRTVQDNRRRKTEPDNRDRNPTLRISMVMLILFESTVKNVRSREDHCRSENKSLLPK